jgi:hypothetical protein
MGVWFAQGQAQAAVPTGTALVQLDRPPVWMGVERSKSFPLLGFEPRTFYRTASSCLYRPYATYVYVEGKAIPLQAWTDLEGSRRLRLPDFVTTTHEGGKVVSPTHRPPLLPGNIPGTHFC